MIDASVETRERVRDDTAMSRGPIPGGSAQANGRTLAALCEDALATARAAPGLTSTEHTSVAPKNVGANAAA